MPDQTYSVTIRATDSVGLWAEWVGSITIVSTLPQTLYIFYQNVAAPFGAIVFRRTISGGSWESLGVPNSDMSPVDVGVIDKRLISARSNSANTTIYTTADMVVFAQSPPIPQVLSNPRGCDLGEGVVLFPCQTGDAFCLRSVDYGETLAPVDVPGYNEFTGGSFIKAGSEALMININHVFASSDNGLSWVLRKLQGGIDQKSSNPRYAYDGGTICYPGNGSNVLVTTDNFATRVSVAIPGTSIIARTAVLGTNWVAQDDDGRLWCADAATGPWAAATMPDGWEPDNATSHDLITTEQGFIASMRSGRLMESTNGKVWVNITPPLPIGNAINSIALLG